MSASNVDHSASRVTSRPAARLPRDTSITAAVSVRTMLATAHVERADPDINGIRP